MAAATPAVSAQVVGNAFVEQYYHILHHSPELAYQFYQDISVLSRPNHNGIVTVATTMKGINDVICSLDYKNYKAEIKTADAQESYHNGVFLLVTGSLTGNDNQKRKFTQSFFLAPQDTGYFILNDVFRYVEDDRPEVVSGVDVGFDGALSSNLSKDPVPAQEVELPQSDLAKAPVEEIVVVEEKENGQVIDVRPPSPVKEVVVDAKPHSNGNRVPVDSEAAVSVSVEDTPKKSYASILSSQTKRGATKVYVPANTSRVAPEKVEKQPVIQPSEVSAPAISSHQPPAIAPENNDISDEDEGHSIYIRNLPLNATVTQLEAEFKKFGTIKTDGIQVRNNMQQGFCFGFVEFQEFTSMQNAVKASPITIGGRQAYIEVKRATSRVGSGRSRFPPTRGGFRNENFRGRGNMGRGRAYVRSDSFRDHGNSGGGAPTAEAYRQVRVKGSHQLDSNQNLVANQS